MTLPAGAISLMKDINGKLGTDTVVLGSEMAVPGRYTTGSLSLDVALGGGWPANQWCEVIGEAMAGKTACVLKTVAANQAIDPDYVTFWVAAERYDEQQATALGVDNSRMIIATTQNMEEALSMMVHAADSRQATCIVLDSYPALIPAEEDEKGIGEVNVAAGARLFGKFFRKVGKASHRAVRGGDPSFHGIIINQYRDKIGGWSPTPGTPQTTPGGKAKDFAYFARVEAKRLEYIEEKRPGLKVPVKVGQTIRFSCIKNKSAAPQQRAEVRYFFRASPFLGYARGEYDPVEYVEMAKLFGIVTGSTWLVDTRTGEKYNGKATMVTHLRENPDYRQELRADVLRIASDPMMVDNIAIEQYEEARA